MIAGTRRDEIMPAMSLDFLLKITGELADDGASSPHGVWEISDEGRTYLEKAKKEG